MRSWESVNVLSSAAGHWNRWIVAIYKALGFVVLVAILLGLSSYLGLQLFFFTDRRWVTPALVSPSDPKVLQLSTQLAQEVLLHDKLHSERLEVVARLRALERVIAIEDGHQRRLRKAVTSGLRAKRAELSMMDALARRARRSRVEIERANLAYAGMSKGRISELYQARLIAEDDYISGHHQLAELELTNLSLAERTVAIVQRAAQLRLEADALAAISRDLEGEGAGGAHAVQDEPPLTRDLLGIRHDYDRSASEVARAKDDLAAARAGVAAVERALERHERLLRMLSESPYAKARERTLAVAFVPYENMSSATPGAQLFGCSVGPLVCRAVGRVASVLPGETQAPHPIRSQQLRGVMVELELFEPSSIEHQVLHCGRAPLLL